jgi:hypothetical protein
VTTGPAGGTGAPSGPVAGLGERQPDPLVGLRTELEGIEALAVAERAEVFERANAVLARELAELDEV